MLTNCAKKYSNQEQINMNQNPRIKKEGWWSKKTSIE